jgi:hypothetical protein
MASLAPEHPRDPVSDHIFIPPDLRGIPLPTVSAASARFRKFCEYHGFQILGDLHGRRLSDFSLLRLCGRKTLFELEALVSALHRGVTTAESLPGIGSIQPPPHLTVLSVAPSARALTPLDLPLSHRAEIVFRKLGIRRLGDLEGLPSADLTDCDRCGPKTAQEILTLLTRAHAGEFDLSPEALHKLSPFDFSAQMDALLGGLPKRDLRILTRRLAGSDEPPPTLAAIGLQFHLTRERVRQILSQTLARLIRLAGPKNKALLNAIAAACHREACPLTPELLLHWAPKPWPLRYQPEFHLRLITELRPDIPIRPAGQKAPALTLDRIDRLSRTLASSLQAAARNLRSPVAPDIRA